MPEKMLHKTAQDNEGKNQMLTFSEWCIYPTF